MKKLDPWTAVDHQPHETNFRAVLGHFASGVAVVTAIAESGPAGMTIQSFTSLSLSPPLVLICPGINSLSWPLIGAANGLCINLLAEGQEDIARQFARSGTDKFAGVDWSPSPVTQSPILDGVLAWIDAEAVETHRGGDHWIVTCRVLALAAKSDSEPLVFLRGVFVPQRRGA